MDYTTYLVHHGIKGQKWGIRRYQNPDGTLTEAGRKRYSDEFDRIDSKLTSKREKAISAERNYHSTLRREQGRKPTINPYARMNRIDRVENAYRKSKKATEKYDKALMKATERYSKLKSESSSSLSESMTKRGESWMNQLVNRLASQGRITAILTADEVERLRKAGIRVD